MQGAWICGKGRPGGNASGCQPTFNTHADDFLIYDAPRLAQHHTRARESAHTRSTLNWHMLRCRFAVSRHTSEATACSNPRRGMACPGSKPEDHAHTIDQKGLNLSRADARLSDQLRRSTQTETESPVTFLLPSLPMPSYHFCIATETRSPSILMVFQAPQ